MLQTCSIEILLADGWEEFLHPRQAVRKGMCRVPVTLGTIIQINSSKIFASDESSTGSSDTRAKEERGSSQTFSKLPKCFDPNLGLVPFLPPLNVTYEAKMNQPWNIAPYFLETLPQSPCGNLDDCILVFGGFNPSKPEDFVLASSIFEFDVEAQKWRYYGCMMEPRCYHAVSLMDSFVFVTEREGEMLAISSTDRLDVRTTLWKRCSDMKEARASHAMATVGKHLFVFGGRNAFGK
ncbi:beta-scruin [Trichonephila inaurata madagascariensis]|uniref:Beta-scruin n=1 Tax=Trichonephila inaurata madagascariensis TaxID=2747483 RepID=A0A8X6WRB0_9ARAC|nr:beta-scruin [Trichonephila inaurata madagascariensis]